MPNQSRRVAALVSALSLASIAAAGMGTTPSPAVDRAATTAAMPASAAETPLSGAFAGVRMPDAAGYSTGD